MESLFSFVFCVCMGCRRRPAVFAEEGDMAISQSRRASTTAISLGTSDVARKPKGDQSCGACVLASIRRKGASPSRSAHYLHHDRRRSSSSAKLQRIRDDRRGSLYMYSDDEGEGPTSAGKGCIPVIEGTHSGRETAVSTHASHGCSKSSYDANTCSPRNNETAAGGMPDSVNVQLQQRHSPNSIHLSSPDYHPLESEGTYKETNPCPIFIDETTVFQEEIRDRNVQREEVAEDDVDDGTDLYECSKTTQPPLG
eukprot:GILI01009535.1.p1 GENE.GILI01009535.1~~GILI01009535.1.p1  ORF type:complete len:254 (+),score=22.36 GILI01009535.1:103-864(+)